MTVHPFDETYEETARLSTGLPVCRDDVQMALDAVLRAQAIVDQCMTSARKQVIGVVKTDAETLKADALFEASAGIEDLRYELVKAIEEANKLEDTDYPDATGDRLDVRKRADIARKM